MPKEGKWGKSETAKWKSSFTYTDAPPHTHTLIGMLTHTGNSCTTLHNVKGISLVLKDNVFKIRALI